MQDINQDQINYDAQWKAIIETQFEDFIGFFLPQAYDLIDFAQPVEFLEQELHKIVADKVKEGKVINDKLVKVSLKNGEDKWILIHIEVQSSFESQFSKRMFTYFYRIWDRYNQDVTAIAIYTGEKVPSSFDRFHYSFLGTENTYRFNAYQVRKAKEVDLIASQNPFALAVLATKYLHQSKKDPLKRFAFKRKLVELARAKGHNSQQIISLLQFINLLLLLPDNLELEFADGVIRSFSKSNDMTKAQIQEHFRPVLPLLDAYYMQIYGESLADREKRILEENTKKVREENAKKLREEKVEKAKLEFVHQKLINVASTTKNHHLETVTQKQFSSKLEGVIEILEKTSLPVKQIAEIVGFSQELITIIKAKLKEYTKLPLKK